MKTDAFKICPNCQASWPTMDEFLSDPELKMNGYQIHFDDLAGGIFFFTHHHEGCFTTLSIPVTDFLPLNDIPFLATRDKELCHNSDFCARQGSILPHPAACECAWVREILKTVREWDKAENPTSIPKQP